MKLDDVLQLVKTWESQYNLDVSRLDNKDFVLFLQSTKSTGHKELFELIESLRQNKEEQAKDSVSP